MKEKLRNTHKKKHFLLYGVLIFVLLFVINIFAAYLMHAYIVRTSCKTPTIGCAMTPTPVLTILPTITTNPTKPPFVMQIVASDMPTNTASQSPVLLPNATITPSLSLPVSTAPTMPAIHLMLAFSGISSTSAIPHHLVRTATVSIYNATDTLGNSAIQPLATISGQIAFDTATASAAHTLFISPAFSLGTLTAGQYQLLVTVPGYAEEQIMTGGNKLISLAPGQITPLQQITMLAGDIDGNGSIDIADYNGLLRCYGKSALTPSCANEQLADLNDDGQVDATDYNIFLSNLYKFQKANSLVTPTSVPLTPTVTISKVSPAKLTTTNHAASPTPVKKKPSAVAGIVRAMLYIIIFLVICAAIIIGIMRSNILAKFTKKQTAVPQNPSSPTAPQEAIDDVYFVKPTQIEANNTGEWVVLVNGDKQTPAYSQGKIIPEGFARIKGVLKETDGKKYVAISEVLPAA